MNEAKSESRGAMTAPQFYEKWGGILPGDLPDWFRCYEFADALSAHNTAELRAALEVKEKELAKIQPAMRALEGLTPSGSEFVGDVKRCVQYVRDAQESQHRVILNFSKRAKDAESELERLRSQGAGQWEAGRDAAAAHLEQNYPLLVFRAAELRKLQHPTGLASPHGAAEALKRYGIHLPPCANYGTVGHETKECDCGLSAAIERLASPPEGQP